MKFSTLILSSTFALIVAATPLSGKSDVKMAGREAIQILENRGCGAACTTIEDCAAADCGICVNGHVSTILTS